MGIGNPKTCVYQFIIAKSNEHNEVITQLFKMNGLGLCVNLKFRVSHMFHGWNFSYYTNVPIIFRKSKNYLYCDDYTTFFYWDSS